MDRVLQKRRPRINEFGEMEEPVKHIFQKDPAAKVWKVVKGTDTELIEESHHEVVPHTELAKRLDELDENGNEVRIAGRLNEQLTLLKVYDHQEREIVLKEDSPPPNGVYTIHNTMQGLFIESYAFKSDSYIDLTGHTDGVMKDINNFINSRELYKEAGLLHKRGILLYGYPGNGKTMLLEEITRRMADKALIFFINDVGSIGPLREMLDGRFVIFVCEEFTNQSGERVLSFLDGENSWDNCLTLGTTNYPEKIPGNLIDRPGRFDALFEFTSPNAEARRQYLEAKLGVVPEGAIEDTEGLTFAYLKELVVATKIYGTPFKDILRTFRARQKQVAGWKDQRKAGLESC